jgi:hypothetical protein
MNPNDDELPMDLTHYLQTEGRRRAAELAANADHDAPELARPSLPGASPEGRPPQSLSEFLQAMGVAPGSRQQPAQIKPRHPL